jgi:glycosyltransferase involved in cell wall biosynthesis
MRICIVTHSLYESDCRVMRYAEALAARGDEVEVFALQKGDKPSEEVMSGVRVFRIQKRDFREKKKSSFLRTVMLFFVKAAWQLTRHHMKQPYDVLHINSIPDFLVFVALIPKLTGAKVILDIHDIMPELYASKFQVSEKSMGYRTMLWLERLSTSFSDHVIIANHIWQEKLASRSVRAEKCSVFLNYPDRRVFRPVDGQRRPHEFVMLYPGTLNAHQGLDVAIRAFALIKDCAPHAQFWIHGEGRTQDALSQLVKDLQLEDRVLFKPMLPVTQIARVMSQAHLAVVPKRKDGFGNEAFSTKIPEFMCVGVPVLVSDTKIDKYYFNDSVVKFFRDGDEHDLAGAMLLLIRDSDLRRSLAKNASDFIRNLDWDTHKENYLRLVDSVAGKKAWAAAV